MKMHLECTYEKQDPHENSIAKLNFTMETADTDFRNKIYNAIRNAIADPTEIGQSNSAIGFHTDHE